MTNAGVNGFPSTGNVVADGTITAAKLAASGQPWLIPNQLTTGEETFPRMLIATGGQGGSGQLRLVYFTARKAETVTQVRLITGSVAAAATPTVCRVGLYTVDSYGNGVLVAATVNDTSLFSVASTAYTKSFASPYYKVAGQRYAAGYIVVTGAANPSIAGLGTDISPGGRSEFSLSPRLAGVLTGQSDLPASFADSSLTNAQLAPYMAILP